jgi:hypothetical protein
MPKANREMAFGELVRILVATLYRDGVSLPFKSQEAWHLLFYSLKKQRARGKPRFLSDLVFDWDGYYPKCGELADFLNALHVTANISALNPKFETIAVDKDDADRWSQKINEYDQQTQTFVKKAADLARSQFLHGVS